MGRNAPALSQKETERQGALLALDVARMRRYCAVYGFGALGSDRVVLIAMHEARVLDPAMPPEARADSRAWLAQHLPESAALQAPELPEVDSAFLAAGVELDVEVQQLPAGELHEVPRF